MTNDIYIVFLSSEFFPMCVWWLYEHIYKNETLLHIVFGTFFIYYVIRFSILINTYLQITVTHVVPHSYPSMLTQSLAVRRAFRSILCRQSAHSRPCEIPFALTQPGPNWLLREVQALKKTTGLSASEEATSNLI